MNRYYKDFATAFLTIAFLFTAVLFFIGTLNHNLNAGKCKVTAEIISKNNNTIGTKIPIGNCSSEKPNFVLSDLKLKKSEIEYFKDKGNLPLTLYFKSDHIIIFLKGRKIKSISRRR